MSACQRLPRDHCVGAWLGAAYTVIFGQLFDFERESEVLRNLNHRNIVQYYGSGYMNDEDGNPQPFMVCELAGLGSLTGLLHDQQVLM